VDSGASRHITPYRELLVDYTVLRSGVDVTFGNGQTATAAGTGSIKLTTGGAGNAIVLQDVLFVPQATSCRPDNGERYGKERDLNVQNLLH
jgi:hypothetical protein